MKCQNCNKSNATYHKVEIINGISNEIHLCSDCALNLTNPFKTFSIGEFFADSFFQTEKTDFKPITKKCNICKTKLSEFLKTGNVGCSNCYKVFSEELKPIIESTQGAQAVHNGKSYKKGK